MAKKKYLPISLANASAILRAHATQVEPPGMLELKNVYLSRSDSAITMRPDFRAWASNPASISEDLQGAITPEFLTGAYYVLEADGTIYFSNHLPFSFENLVIGVLCDIYDEGTITTRGGSDGVVFGSGTEFLEYVWAGCLIREKDGTDLYRITEVKSNLYLVTSPAMPALTGSQYEILRTHPAEHGAWPMHFERLGNILVYNPVKPALPVDLDRISGPFYADVGTPDLFGVWREYEPEVSVTTGLVDRIAVSAVDLNRFTPRGNFRYATFLGGEKGFLASQKAWIADRVGDKFGSERNFFVSYNSYQQAWQKNYGLSASGGFGDDSESILRWALWNVQSIPPDECTMLEIKWPRRVTALAQTANSLLVGYEDGRVLEGTKSPVWNEPGHSNAPILISNWYGPYQWISGPVNGIGAMFSPNTVYGQSGQIYDPENGGLLTTGTTADILSHCVGENPAAESWGTRPMFFGGLDAGTSDSLILVPDLTAFPMTFAIPSSGVTADLTASFYLDAMNPGGTGRYVALGKEEGAYSDDDGVTWTRFEHSIGTPIKAAADLEGRCAMVICEGGILAVTENGEDYTVLDGSTVVGPDPQAVWVYDFNLAGDNEATWGPFKRKWPQPAPDVELLDIDFDPTRGQFVIAHKNEGEEGTTLSRISRSYEVGNTGPDETREATILAEALGSIRGGYSTDQRCKFFDLIWTGTNFIAVGAGIYISADGDTWTNALAPVGWSSHFYCVADNGSGKVLACGYDGMMYYSNDHGANWTAIFAPGANTHLNTDSTLTGLIDVVWDDYNFIVVGGPNILQVTPAWSVSAQTFDYPDNLVSICYRGPVLRTHGRWVSDIHAVVSFRYNLIAISDKSEFFLCRNNGEDASNPLHWPTPASATYSEWVAFNESDLVAAGEYFPEGSPPSALAPCGYKGVAAWSSTKMLSVLTNLYLVDNPRYQSRQTWNAPYSSNAFGGTRPGSAFQNRVSTFSDGRVFEGWHPAEFSKTYLHSLVSVGFDDEYKGWLQGILIASVGTQMTISTDCGATWSVYRWLRYWYTDSAGNGRWRGVYDIPLIGAQFRSHSYENINGVSYNLQPTCVAGDYYYRMVWEEPAVQAGGSRGARLLKIDLTRLQMNYYLEPNGYQLLEATPSTRSAPIVTLTVSPAVIT